MSIKQQNEINELRERIENLERGMNKLNQTPRTVAGAPDRDNVVQPKKSNKKG